ncbi:MAG: glycoside hydrolase [Clostridiales bacterium]|nr:glycoside hydrolase [Clostridiales bacterium]
MMENQQVIPFLPEEFWYGLRAADGIRMPLSADSDYEADIDPNQDCNQCAPLLLSSRGRYIWCCDGFQVNCRGGALHLSWSRGKPALYQAGETLRSAFLEARRRFFPSDGRIPPEEFFRKPQYNTWIELMYNQNQADVLRYARSILENGLPAGILMIDDGWAEDYGRWRFHPARFPDPGSMVKELHGLGFRVMMWVCPFVSPDSAEFRQLRERGLLVREAEDRPAVREWWNGCSAVLDLSNPEADAWFRGELDSLIGEYGIDGFKFDAGDGQFYRNSDKTFGGVSANDQTRLWGELGARYSYNEFRACYRCAELPLVQRLADKYHSWGGNGVASLIPNQVMQGLLGYAFTCPDMIGGGDFLSFLNQSDSLDEELFVRYAQCAALMPMMQFSAAPWRVLSAENAALCVEAARLHLSFADRIVELARQTARTGEPVVRHMAYQFPGEGFEQVDDQFVLGETLVVAPVLKKGGRERLVRLPRGRWRHDDGTESEGGIVKVNAPLSRLPRFEKIG